MNRRSLLCAIALAAAGCSEKPDVRARLDGVPAPVVYLCSHPKPSTAASRDVTCQLEIKTAPLARPTVPDCARPELAEDGAGKSVAYRCPGQPWSVVRLGGTDRYLVDCNAPVGTGATPEWSKLDPLGPRATALIECSNGSARAWTEVADAITKESGAEAAARFLVSTSLRAPSPSDPEFRGHDGWLMAFEALPAPSKALVKKEICPALQNASSPSLLYVRAAQSCPYDATNVGDVALGAYRNHLGASRRDFAGSTDRTGASAELRDLTVAELAFVFEGAIARTQKPKEAAQASCEHIGAYSREYDPLRVMVAASVLGLTKTRCPAVDRKSDLWPCDLASPRKSLIEKRVAQFGVFAPGAPLTLPTANEAMFEAVTIDGQYPPGWKCPE